MSYRKLLSTIFMSLFTSVLVVTTIDLVALSFLSPSQQASLYEKFKEQQQENWRQEGITTPLDQQVQLVDFVRHGLRHPEGYLEWTLNAYNYLREMLSENPDTPKTPATSLNTIDKDWVNNVGFDLWKAQQQELWRKEALATPLEKQKSLLDTINRDFSVIDSVSTEAAYAYNLLREMHGDKPTLPPTATHISDSDKKWIKSIESVAPSVAITASTTPNAAMVGYEQWKKQEQEDWHKQGIATPLEQQTKLLDAIRRDSDTIDHISTQAVYAYNLLREVLGSDPTLPAPAMSINDINKDWMSRLDYEIWKNQKQEYWRERGIATPSEQQKSLIITINNGIKDPESTYASTQAVRAYNFLREMLASSDPATPKTAATSLDTIDKDWVNNISYDVWKKATQEDWSKEGITTPAEQQESLLSLIDFGLELPDLYSTDAVNSYNYLREMLVEDEATPKAAATSLEDIDEDWVNIISYEVWKKTTQEDWSKESITTPSEQQKSLLDTINDGIKDPDEYETEAVNAYNYLREMHSNDPKLPPASTSISDIDKTWLESIESSLRVQPKARISIRLYALALKNALSTNVEKRDQLIALYNQLPTATATQRKTKEKAREKFREKFGIDPQVE